MPSLRKIDENHDENAKKPSLQKRGDKAKMPSLPQIGAVKKLPAIHNSIFESDDYLQAIGDISDDEKPPKKQSHYMTMGVGSGSAIATKMPDRPDCSGMTPRSEKRAMHDYILEKKAYQRDKKAATDALRKARRVEAGGRAVNWATIEYSGDNTPTLRPRDLVRRCYLSAGQNIMDKEMVQMRIAEEAMLRGLEIKYTQSTNDRVIADSDGFHVHATLNEKYGWVIKAANMEDFDDVVDDVYEDDDDESGDDNDEEKKKEKLKPLRTPLSSDWIVPLIKEVIAVKPNTSNSDLHHILSTYCRKYALTRGVLQKARDKSRLDIFGTPEVNAKYVAALQDELRLRQNVVKVVTTDRATAITKLQMMVLADEVARRKAMNLPVLLQNQSEARMFLQNWMIDNEEFVDEHFGNEDANCRFILGILFAPQTAARYTVKNLQNLYQADAAHLQFGKYTFYSAYGTTANANASPIAFGILFGNEDKKNWEQFWEFAKVLHPHLDSEEVTIVTDQDKGSKSAIARVLPKAKNFHCSWHRRSNILKVSSALCLCILINTFDCNVT